MRSLFTLNEVGQRALFIFILRFLCPIFVRVKILASLIVGGIYGAPSWIKNFLSGSFKLRFVNLTQNRGRREFAVRIECGNKTTGNQVIHLLLGISELARHLPGRNNGVVVGHLRCIENSLRLCEFLSHSCQSLNGLQIGLLPLGIILADTIKNTRAFRIDII